MKATVQLVNYDLITIAETHCDESTIGKVEQRAIRFTENTGKEERTGVLPPFVLHIP